VGIALIRYSDRPDLWEDTGTVTEEVWPEYNHHGDVLNNYWQRLFEEFPGYQFVLYDEREREVVAEGHTAPCSWDGTSEGLGDGIDDMIVAAFAARERGSQATALCALAAEIRPRYQGRGLAARILDAMAGVARDHGLAHLIAPVRPSFKHRYPITPIARYVRWTREDGQPFDPWIRTHTRRGGELVKPVPQSLRITGTVAEWEQWTDMRFPDDGTYTFPAGLATLEIDHARGLGSYWEPNVWIVHALDT
jgi:GNAT superfamily N-acetyltransferase